MSREIIIDSDTLIGYDFPNKIYYVTNKETTTKRTSKEEAKKVLDIVAPLNTVSLEDLQSLHDTLETLYSLSYTWEDTGAYIKTIQLNTWEEYPLTLDAEKQKLYIMNSDIIYDLSLNEGSLQRLQYIQTFYVNKLGLNISLTDLGILYDLLISYYNPTPYNSFTQREVDSSTGEYKPLRYSNTIILPNYSKKSPATYTLTLNPTGEYTQEEVAKVLAMLDNKITLTNSAPSSIRKGSVITTTNTGITESYTISNIEDNILTIDGEFQAEYICNTPILYLRAYNTSITSMSMSTAESGSTITLSSPVPNEILLGDKITVVGATISTEYDTITLDGEYTVIAKEENTITVGEQIATNYTGTTANIYKPITLGLVNSVNISTNTLTLAEAPLQPISSGSYIAITYPDNSIRYGTVTGVNGKEVTVNFTLTNFPTGLLVQKIPYPEVMINIETSSNTSIMPIGEFKVDSSTQCTQYIDLLSNLEAPTTEQYTLNGIYAPMTHAINTSTVQSMTCKGLYTEVYHDMSM